MRYLLLIYAEESATPKPGSAEHDKMLQNYGALAEEMQAKGVLKAGNGLESVTTATTVRVKNGKVQTTDGPFAETKEQLGGYFLLDCQNLDEAIAYAGRIPGIEYGSVEIRPIFDCGA